MKQIGAILLTLLLVTGQLFSGGAQEDSPTQGRTQESERTENCMILVEGGSFLRGSPESGRYPVHSCSTFSLLEYSQQWASYLTWFSPSETNRGKEREGPLH